MRHDQVRAAVQAVAEYDFGRTAAALFELDRLINASHGDSEARSWIEAELARILESGASLAAKQEVCRRLWRIGTDDSLGALAKLLEDDDPKLVAASCYAIGRRPSARADEALKSALRKAPQPCRAAIESLIEDRI